ncbi:MAG: YybS family protein [Syntrophobacteraceae bacterium]|jgi:uncharacterized protein YybS (DUF2232 family)|nr:YybS family protein [Syntrophobacteraceae bacterium]
MAEGNDHGIHGASPATRREFALGIAATLLFFLSAIMIPVLGFLAGIFTPLPTLLTFYRLGLPLGLWIPGGALALGSAVLFYLGMGSSIPYLVEMLAFGLILASGMRQGWSTEKTLGASSLVVFAAGAMAFWMTNGGPEGALFSQVEEELKGTVAAALQQYAGTSADRELIQQSLEQIIPVLVTLMPGFSMATSLVMAWLNVLVARRYCRIHGVALPPWPEWSQWKAPEKLVWCVIGAGFVMILSDGTGRIVALNLLIVLSTVYLFQGLAIVAFYSDKWKIPRLLRAFIYGFLLLQQFATLGAVLMGLFDMWLDFRRISPRPSEPAQSPE